MSLNVPPAVCSFYRHIEISLWQLFVSSFKWLAIHFLRNVFIVVCMISFHTHVIYMANWRNQPQNYFWKMQNGKCCHILTLTTQTKPKKSSNDECIIRCANGKFTHTGCIVPWKCSICAMRFPPIAKNSFQFSSAILSGGFFLSLAASFCDGIIHTLLTLNDE